MALSKKNTINARLSAVNRLNALCLPVATPCKMKRQSVLHAAVVLEYRLDAICSFDRDFDRIRAIRRIEPS